jgi:MFS family permease
MVEKPDETPLLRRIASLLVAIAGSCGQSLIFSALPPALPLIAAHFGGGQKGAFFAQMLMTMPSLGLLLGGLVSGLVVDRGGLRRVMIMSMFFYGALGACGLFVTDAYLLLGTRFMFGLAASCLTVSCTAFVIIQFQGTARHRAFSWQGAATGATGIVAVFLSGALVGGGDWRSPFILYPLMVALPLIAAVFVVPSVARATDLPRMAMEEVPTRSLWPVYLTIMPLTTIIITGSVQLPFLLVEKGIVDPMAQTVAIGGGHGASIVGALLFPLLLKRGGEGGTLCACLALIGAGLLGSAGAAGLFGVVAMNVAFSLGIGIVMPFFPYLIASRASELTRNRALGWFSSAAFVGAFFNPPLMAFLGKFLSLQEIYVALGIAMALAALVPLGFFAKGGLSRIEARLMKRR